MIINNQEVYESSDLPDSKKDRLRTSAALHRVGYTSFDELKTASRYAQIELKSAVDQVSVLRNYVQSTNAGVSVNETGEYRVFTNAVQGANVSFESGERGRYISGYQAEQGVGIRIPEQTWQGTEYAEWGYFDDENGLGWGVDQGGKYIFIDRLGSRVKKIYQSDWNVDTLDGSKNKNNPSKFEYDLADGNIDQIEFIWYGYGSIKWRVNVKDNINNTGSVPVTVHIENPDDSTSVAQPNLPITVRINNGDQSTAKEVYVGGRQFSIFGNPLERFRLNGDIRQGQTLPINVWTPIISFRRKADIGNLQTVELGDVNLVVDANVIFGFVLSGTLSNANFGDLSDTPVSETVCESDISATAISGGTHFGGKYIAVGNNQSNIGTRLDDINFNFINSEIVSLVARPVGNQSVSLNAATLNVKEKW